VLHEVLGEGLEHLTALMEGELAQVCAADIARMLQHIGEIESVAGDPGDGIAIDRTGQGVAIAITVDPLVKDQVAKFACHTELAII
jgi:hypothetical protein